ncbi:MAG: asparagine synthetase B [Blautia sp.]|nr:asparagine synthetase B [Blautia sp.]
MTEVRQYIGSIRNWRQLCGELGLVPASDRSTREKEILARAYEVWGSDMGNHIYGSFAFTIYSEEDGCLFGCRDQLGTRPLYYYRTADRRLLTGLSMREIISQEGFVKELNEGMLQLYLGFTYCPGAETFYKGLYKLLPGRYFCFKDGDFSIGRYYKPEYRFEEGKSLQDWADEIHETIRRIVPEVKDEEERAESFLSGGVDSSYLVAMTDVQMTASAGYEDARFDESPLSKETADALGKGNRRCVITPERYFEMIPKVMQYLEQPLGDASTVVLAIACQEEAKVTKLCYSGEGADEFFGGYNIYKRAEVYGDNLKTFYVGNTNIMKEDEKQKLLKVYDPERLPIGLAKELYEELEGLDPLTKMMAVDTAIWLDGDIYFAIDKLSQATGLEIRMPFTDLRLYDVALRMPPVFKVDQEKDKVAFRQAASKVLPEEVAFRKKLGFPVPIRLWLATEPFISDVRKRFEGEAAKRYFHEEAILAILEEYVNGNDQLWRKVWTIYAFLIWYEECYSG